MTTPDYRAELAALVAAYDKHGGKWPQEHEDALEDAVARARALLADHVPDARKMVQPPAAGEVAELVAEIRHFLAGYGQMRGLDPENIYSIHRGHEMEAHITVSKLARAAELLERLAPPQSIPVAERPWEREGWCDSEGLCWWCPPEGPPYWQQVEPAMVYGGWLLPAHALPRPLSIGEVPG